MLSTSRKTERITARVSTDIREQLIEAAAFSGSTLNQFLVQAALEKAHAVIEKERNIKLSYKDAEVFFNALENPPEPNKKLKDAVKKYKISELYEQAQS
ncbi:MAG: DUF1778 domain-containing protein [SAR324 cluster bacterium]|nr:DUF1778 domain-containing protein [SAR324 cluster bacterium]